MVVPGNALGLGDALIFDGGLEDHAVAQLVDDAALDLLPGSLAFRDFVAAGFGQGLAALAKLLLREEDVGRSRVEVDTDPVTGPEQG